MMLIRFKIVFLFFFLVHFKLFSQTKSNNIELRIKNDNAGELSNLLNTGDDLGETQSFLLSVNLLELDSVFNFRVKVESTEYSALNYNSPEPRDILFTEQNNFQLSVDNNKFSDNSFFYSASAGLYYIQGDKITLGATGQKYYVHKWIISKFFPGKYWQYVASPVDDSFIPYLELKYGHNKSLFKNVSSSLSMINDLECRAAGYFNFTGIGARTNFNLRLSNQRFKMHAVDIDVEGYYLTNFTQYQIAYCQLGVKCNFSHVSIYFQANKPLKKYLDNPFIKYDDMELLFNYGLLVYF